MNNTVFKLYKYPRSYGNKCKREKVNHIYITSSTNMIKLVEKIKQSNEGKEFTFYIKKYIDNSIRWRQLGRANSRALSGWREGDLTTTWEKYVWDDKKKIWHPSNYRYDDEIVK